MKKFLLLLIISITLLFGSDNEKLFWDEVKDSNDIEMLKLYKQKYPKGLFEPLADIKIKRLLKAKRVTVQKKEENTNEIPHWIKGYTSDYKYYGVGKANKHFKGKEYQRYLALKRAKRELIYKLQELKLSKDTIDYYMTLLNTKEYINYRERLFILVFIEDDEL